MKTKLIVGFIALVIIIGGGWYALKLRNTSSYTVDTNNINKSSESVTLEDIASTSPSKPTETKTAPISTENTALKARAMKIIDHATVFAPTISETSKKSFEKNIEDAKNNIRQNYNTNTSWLTLGAYYQAAGDYQGAITAWDFLTTIRPKEYVAFHNLGSLYGFELHNYPKSEENFLKAIENEPKDFDAYSQLVTVYEAYKPEKIEGLLLSGIQANQKDVALKIMLGKYYAGIGKKAEALTYLEEALKLNPTNTELKAEIEELKK